MSILQVINLALLIISILFCIISLATDYWVIGPGENMGLWKKCVNDSCFSLPQLEFPPHSRDYTEPIVFIDCARAATILTLLFLVAATIVHVLMIWCKQRLRVEKKQRLTSIFGMLAATSEIIGMAVFRPYPTLTGSDLELAWSYFLGWATAGFSMVAGVLAMYAFASEPDALNKPLIT